LGQVDPAAISIRAGFDSSWDDSGDRSGMGRSLLQGACCFIFASYTACQLVGISVGIGNNRRQKLLQIQLVMALGGYRSGAGHGNASHENSSSWFAISATGIEPPTRRGRQYGWGWLVAVSF
jgi:hypothetical protein